MPLGRLIRFLILAAFMLGILVVAAGALLYVISGGRPVNFVQKEVTRLKLAGRQDALSRPVGSDDRPIRFTVNAGDTPPIVAQNLFSASLISNPDLYVDYAFVNGLTSNGSRGVLP
jgi:hypothetical protein